MLQYMKPLSPGEVPRVLMLGNGINRAFESENWDALLRTMTDGRFTDDEWKELCGRFPYPLLAVIASDDSVGDKMREKGKEMCAHSPAEEQKQLLSCLSDAGINAILTTNYTYEAEQSLIQDFKCVPGRKLKYRYVTCAEKPKAESDALYTYNCTEGLTIPPIWHIHGEAGRPDSMIIGHYYYGKLLSRIQSYVAETVKRYNIAERAGNEFYPRSWVDYFLFGDVTIVGLGMDLSEMDLWWLFNCKKRNGRGKLTYLEPCISKEKQLLAEIYGADVKSEPLPAGGYREYFTKTIKSL